MTTADIPRVRVRDPKTGHVLLEGYYFEFPEWNRCPVVFDGETPQEVPLVRGIVTYNPGDWNMANEIRIVRVTPPHEIEVIEQKKPEDSIE